MDQKNENERTPIKQPEVPQKSQPTGTPRTTSETEAERDKNAANTNKPADRR